MARRTTPVVVGSRVGGTVLGIPGSGGRSRAQAIRILVIVSIVTAMLGCRTYRVKTDWDPAVAFDGMQSFYFLEPPEFEGSSPFADNSLLRKRVREAVETVFSGRGFRSVSSRETADFIVTYIVVLDEEIQINGVSSSVGGAYRRGGAYGGVYANTSVRTYQESTLILDLLDPSSEDLVWRGWGIGIVGTRDRQRGLTKIEKGVRAILKKFPPER